MANNNGYHRTERPKLPAKNADLECLNAGGWLNTIWAKSIIFCLGKLRIDPHHWLGGRIHRWY